MRVLKQQLLWGRLCMLLTAAFSFFSAGCKKAEQLDRLDLNSATDITLSGRTFTLLPGTSRRIVIDNSNKYYKPGDVIYLKGKFLSVSFTNMSGTAGSPIIVRNAPGVTTVIGNPTWSGGSWAEALTFTNCHYIKVGSPSKRSEFVIRGSSKAGRDAYFDLVIRKHTDNMEVRHMTIYYGGTGIWAKTDPVRDDASTWYPNTVMQNLSIHDVTIGETLNEAMYIGHTATYWDLTGNVPYYNAPSGFVGGHQYVQPIKWRNVKIYNNIVFNIGSDGIQTAATDQLQIFNNDVSNWGTRHNYAHNGGILIGGRNTNTNTYNNYVHDGWGELCQFYGSGENGATHIIHNNLFRSNQEKLDGVSLRGTNKAVVKVTNNTIAKTGGVSLRVNGYNGMTAAQIVNANAFIQPYTGGGYISSKAYVYVENGAKVIEGTGSLVNKRYATVTAAKVNTSHFQPLPGSTMLPSGYKYSY